MQEGRSIPGRPFLFNNCFKKFFLANPISRLSLLIISSDDYGAGYYPEVPRR